MKKRPYKFAGEDASIMPSAKQKPWTDKQLAEALQGAFAADPRILKPSPDTIVPDEPKRRKRSAVERLTQDVSRRELESWQEIINEASARQQRQMASKPRSR